MSKHSHCSCEHEKKEAACSCDCCHHEHDREHENSSRKGTVLKLAVTAILLLAFSILTKLFSLPSLLEPLLFAVPYLISGAAVLLGAIKGILKKEIFSESLLMSIATIGAFFIGEYAEAVFVMLFFGIGELLEHIASDRSRASINALMDIRPDTAALLKGGEEKECLAKDINVGDIIIVRPGERIPLDGCISDGSTTLDTSALTGESLPREVVLGDEVASGCINLSSPIKICVSRVYSESTASKILELMEHAAQSKARPQRFITRFSKVYTPAVVIAAACLFLLPSLITGEFTVWLKRALMFLVVSCPCALVVSVPLTYFSGIGCASKKGILIKGSCALELLADTKTAVFDKTGTLTYGKFKVREVKSCVLPQNELIELAALAEYYSDHPIAQSVRSACNNTFDASRIGEVKEHSGRGIEAQIDSRLVLVGNIKLMRQFGIEISEAYGETAVYIADGSQLLGIILLEDEVKPSAAEAVKALRTLGIDSVILTGDRRLAAEKAAEKIGISTVRAELLPEDKVNELEKIMASKPSLHRTAFIGDGINDAPVLTRADIGFALGALGSDAAIEAADIVLMDDELKKIPLAVKISKKTASIVRQNIIFSISVKFAVLLLSALGISGFMLAAFADAGVMLIAVLNSMRAFK